MPLEVQENLIDNTQGEQNDVLNKLNEAKQKVGLNESLVNNLDDIIKKAKSSSEALSVLNGIVKGITVSGKNLDDNLEKVCYCFRQFEERSESAKASLFGLGDAYNKFGKNAPSQFGKIISSLEEVRTIQNDLSKSVSLPIIGQVSALTKEITKLISINKKGMPSMPSKGISLPVVKQMTTLTKEVRGLANIKRNQKSTVNNDIPVRKFATGGIIPGNSKIGDKVPILANSEEIVITKQQAEKLGRIIGGNKRPLSPKQVFQVASGRSDINGSYKNGVQAFYRGGYVRNLKRYTDYLSANNDGSMDSQNRISKFNRLLKLAQDDKIDTDDISRLPHVTSFNDLDLSEIDDLINILSRILSTKKASSSSSVSPGINDDSPTARLFRTAADTMSDNKKHATNGDTIDDFNSRIKESAAINRKLNRIHKSGNSESKRKVEELNERRGIENADDILGMTSDELEDYSEELDEIEENLDEIDEKLYDIKDDMDSTSETLTKMFQKWDIGNILVISGMILVAQKIKEIGENLQEWLSEIVKLNLEYNRLQQNMKSLGGSINMEAVREELNLTREDAIEVAEACKEIAIAGINSMDDVTMIASNLKNALGQVDVSMLKEAVSIIKDLPKEQVNVLLTGTGSFDDKASLLTNLLNDGNLEAAIDLTANGAFGDVNGGVKLSPKDKAIIESQNQANKLLEDIKFGLYDWMPGVVGHAGIIVSTIGTMAANLVNFMGFGLGTYAAVKHLASAAGLGVIHTSNVGTGTPSSWRDMFRNPASIGRFARIFGKVLVWSLIPLAAGWGLDKIAKSYKNEYEYKKIRESGINRARYGTPDGDLSEADKYKRGENTWGDAGTGAAILGGFTTLILGGLALIGTGVGVIPGALIVLGATIVGAVAGAIWGFNKDVNSLFEGKNALDKNYYQKSLKESEKAAKFLNDLKDNDSLEQVVKKQLNEMIQLNKYNKKIQSILSGKRYAYQRQDIQAGLDYMETNSMTGGNDNEYNRIFEDVTRKRIDLIKKESQAISDTTANSLKNTQSDSTKTVIFNDFLSKQKQFIVQVDEEFSKILNSLYKAPGIIKRKLQNEISNLKIELGNQFFMTYDNGEHRKSYGNSAQNIQKYNEQFEKFTKQAETIKLAFKSVRDSADKEMKNTGIKSDKQAQDIVDKGIKDLNEITPHLGDLKYVMDTFTEYGNVNSNEDALAKAPILKESAADAARLAREMGDNELADELGKVQHQLGDVQRILADPKSTEEEKKAALERYKKLTAFVVQMFNKHYQKPLADFKRKNPDYEKAKKYQAAKRVKTSATTAENMVLQQNKNALEEVASQINREADNMRKQIELAFDHGSAVFARTLSNNIEKQKEYDSLANSTTASRASVEASDLILQNLETSLARANDVARESEGKTQEYYNEYRKKLMSSDAGKKKLKEQEENGVAEYQRQLIKETELKRGILTEKSPQERAKLIAQLRNEEEKRKDMEQKDAVRKWMKSSSGDTFMKNFGSIIGPLDAMIKKQSEYKDEYLRQMRIIADVVSNALNDGVVKLSETIMEAASARANFHKTYGNYGKSVSDARDAIKDSMITKEEGVKKINESFEIARAQSMKMYAEAMKETDPEKRRTKLAGAGITMAQAEKNRIEAMEKLYKDMTDRISDYINIKTEKLGRIEESIDIEKDFANQIGAPFEYIVELEKASVQMAREKVRLAEEELKYLEEAGIKGEVLEKAKLKYQKAQAEELKATFGAQRDSIDKMLGKVMGTFQEIGGIFGPNSERMMAKKYGQGYMMNEAGLSVRAGEWTHGFADRTRHAGFGVPTFSSGGKVEKHGKFNFIKQLISLMTGGKDIPFISNGEIPGNSIVGDNMLIRVNSKENVVTKKQMDNIQDLLGLSSHNEVFAAANNPQLLAIRGMDDLQNYIGKSFNSNLPTNYIGDIEKIYGQLSNFSNNGNNEITQQPSIDNRIEEIQKQLLNILPTFANGGPLDKDKSFIAASLLNRKYNHSKVNLSKYFDRQGNFIVSSARKYGMTDNNQYKGALDMSISDALKFKSGTRFQEDVYDPDDEKRIAELHNKKLQAIIDGDVLDATPGALKPIGAGGNNGGNNRGLVPMAFANNGNTATSSNTTPTAANTLYSINQQSKKPSKNQVLRSFDNSFFGKMGNMNPGETKNPEADKLTKISSDVEKILKILNENTGIVEATDKSSPDQNAQNTGKTGTKTQSVTEKMINAIRSSGAPANVIEKLTKDLELSRLNAMEKFKEDFISRAKEPEEKDGKSRFEKLMKNAEISRVNSMVKLNEDILNKVKESNIGGDVLKQAEQGLKNAKAEQEKLQAGQNQSGKLPNSVFDMPNLYTPEGGVNPDVVMEYLERITAKTPASIGTNDDKIKTADNGEEPSAKGALSEEGGKSIRDIENERALAKALKNPCKTKASSIEIQKDILDVAREIRDLLRNGNNSSTGAPKKSDEAPGKPDMSMPDKPDSELPEKPTTRKVPNIPKASMDPTNTAIAAAGILLAGAKVPTAKTPRTLPAPQTPKALPAPKSPKALPAPKPLKALPVPKSPKALLPAPTPKALLPAPTPKALLPAPTPKALLESNTGKPQSSNLPVKRTQQPDVKSTQNRPLLESGKPQSGPKASGKSQSGPKAKPNGNNYSAGVGGKKVSGTGPVVDTGYGKAQAPSSWYKMTDKERNHWKRLKKMEQWGSTAHERSSAETLLNNYERKMERETMGRPDRTDTPRQSQSSPKTRSQNKPNQSSPKPSPQSKPTSPKTPGRNHVPGADKAKGTAGKSVNPFRLDPNNAHTGHIVLSDKEREFVEAIKNSRLGKQVSSTASWLKGKLPEWGKQAYTAAGNLIPKPVKNAAHWIGENAPKAIPLAKAKLSEWGTGIVGAAKNHAPDWMKNAAHWTSENAPKLADWAGKKAYDAAGWVRTNAPKAATWAKNHSPEWLKKTAQWAGENAPRAAAWASNHSPEWLKKTADWVGKNASKAKSLNNWKTAGKFVAGKGKELAARGGRWLKGGGGLRLAGRGLQAYATLMDAKEALGHASNTYNNWGKMSASERTEGIFDTASSVAKGALNWAPLPLALVGRGTLELGEYARDLIHETDAHSENAVESSADVIKKGAKLTKTRFTNRSQSGNFRAFNPDGTATNKDDWERMIKADMERQKKQYKHILHQTGKGGFSQENAKNVAMAKASATGVWDKMTGGSQAKAAKQVALDTVQVKREERAYQLSKLLDLGTTGGGGFNEEDMKMVSDILPQMQSGKRYNYEFARLKKKAVAGSVKTHTGIMEQQNKNAAKLSPDVVFSKENIEEVRRSFPNTEQGRHDLQRFDDIIEERKKMWMAAAAQDQALADQQKDLIGKMKKPGESPEMIARELKDISERRKLIQDSMSKSIPDQWGKKQDQSGQKPEDKNKPEGKNKPGERQVTEVLLPLSARQKNGPEQQPAPDDKQTQSVAAKITDTVTSTMKNAMDSMPNLLQMSGFGQKYQGMLEGDLMSAQMKSIFEQNQSQQYAGSNPNSPKNALGLSSLAQEYASSPTRKKQPFNNFDPNNPFKSNAKDPFAGFDPQNPFTKASSTSINRETVAIMQRLGAANKNLLGNVANQNTPESPNAVPTSALNKEQKIEVVFSLKGDELKKMLQYYVNNNSSAIVKNGLYKS